MKSFWSSDLGFPDRAIRWATWPKLLSEYMEELARRKTNVLAGSIGVVG